jgi:hypothetical protein
MRSSILAAMCVALGVATVGVCGFVVGRASPAPDTVRKDACDSVHGAWQCSGWNCWCTSPACVGGAP